MKKYWKPIALSIFLILGVSFMPFFIPKVDFDKLILVLVSVYFIFPLLILDNQISLKNVLIRYIIVLVPFFVLYSVTAIISKNINILPIPIAMLIAGITSFLVRKKNITIKVVTLLSLLMFVSFSYSIYTQETAYQLRFKKVALSRTTINAIESYDNFKSPRQKLLILEFWTSRCGNCIRDFPKFQEFYTNNKNDFDIYTVNVPLQVDSLSNFKPRIFLDSLKYTFPLKIMDKDLALQLGVNHFPTVVVIDTGNIIRYRGQIKYDARRDSKINFKNILKKIENEI